MTSPAAPEPTNGEHGGLNEWTPASLGSLAHLPIQWAVQSILPLGQPGILAGPPAEGKTTLAMQLAAGKAAGSDVFGIPVAPAPVLFIELEDSPTVIAKRLEVITEGFSAKQRRLLQENFRLWTPGAGLDPRFTSLAAAIYKRLLDLGVKEAGGGVVVIDTLLAVSEGDENAAGAHRELWAIATWLAQELNVVVVFLHHTRKRDPKAPWNSQGLEAIRGSSAQVGSARFVLQLSRTRKTLGPEGGHLPLSDAAITWLRQSPGILDDCWAHGIPREQRTNKVRDTLQNLRAALEVAPAAFSGCANLKANSIRVGSLVIAKGPYGYLGVQVWRRDDDGYERGLGPQGCVLGATPAKATSFFAAQHAEPALTLIRDILCAPDVRLRACAHEKF